MAPVLERSASDIRKNFAQTLNDSEYRKPQFFKRNRCAFGIVSTTDLSQLMSTAVVDVTLTAHSDVFVATSELMFDIVASGATRKEALDGFCHDLYEYAGEYYENFELYAAAPNRKAQLPYVFRALLADGPDEIGSMLVVTDA